MLEVEDIKEFQFLVELHYSSYQNFFLSLFSFFLSYITYPLIYSLSHFCVVHSNICFVAIFLSIYLNYSCNLISPPQMADLADIARCVAGTDLSKEGSCDFLLACMEDLQDILQNTKLKALVIDTFGGRIENLLRYSSVLKINFFFALSNTILM